MPCAKGEKSEKTDWKKLFAILDLCLVPKIPLKPVCFFCAFCL
jgi:hypothetical protein